MTSTQSACGTDFVPVRTLLMLFSPRSKIVYCDSNMIPDEERQQLLEPEGDALTSDEITTKLYEYQQLLEEQLSQSAPISSAAIPFREITSFVTNVVVSNHDSPLILKVCTLYVDLISCLSVAYDEITFSSTMHILTTFLKDASSPSNPACTQHSPQNRSMLCTATHCFFVNEFVNFWDHLAHLLHQHCLDLDNRSLLSHIVRAVGDIIHYARNSALLRIATDLSSHLVSIQRNQCAVISSLYKALFPVLIDNIPTSNRNALVEVLRTAAKAEDSALRNASLVSQSDKGSNEEEDQVQNNKDDDDAEITSITSAQQKSNVKDKTARRPHLISESADENNDENSSPVHMVEPKIPQQKQARPLLALFKVCCFRIPDKADNRNSLTKIIYEVLSACGLSYSFHFYNVLLKCATHMKASTRIVAIDLTKRFIVNPPSRTYKSDDIDGGHANDNNIDDTQCYGMLLSILVQRCNDRIAIVRSKAITLLLEVFSNTDLSSNSIQVLTPKTIDHHAKSILERLNDSKSSVRKSAVDFIGFCCRFLLEKYLDEQEYHREARLHTAITLAKKLSERCSDVVASVRLSAANQIVKIIIGVPLFQAIEEDGKQTIMKCIVNVLTLLDDVDSRCREACLHLVRSILRKEFEYSNVILDSNNKTLSHILDVPQLFYQTIGGKDTVLNRLAERTIFTIIKDEHLDSDAIRAICDALSSIPEGDTAQSISNGIWITIAAIASSGKAKQVWEVLGENMMMREIRTGANSSAYKVLAHLSNMSRARKELFERELDAVMFRKPQDNAWDDGSGLSAICEVLAHLKGEENNGDKYLNRCAEMIQTDEEEEMTIQDISHLLNLVGNVCEQMKIEHGPSEQVLSFVQAMTSNTRADSRIRALALITLGKICLCETRTRSTTGRVIRKNVGEILTRRFISVFVHELDNATSSATRSNAVVILCDLCRQFTSLVETYVTRIAALLSDQSIFVRNQVLCSLMCLLQEDYIKVRPGFVLFQILKCLLDESEDVRKTAEYSVIHVIPQKNKNVLAVCFVEVIMVLNKCNQSNAVNQFKSALRTDIVTTGHENVAKRNKIYEVLLRGMTAEQRYRMLGRLRDDVLNLIVEEKISLDEHGAVDMLEDTLGMLSWSQINVFTRRGSGNADESQQQDQAEGEGGANAILRNIQLVELRECTIPLLIELRQFLQTKRSPVLGTLNKCLCSLLQPHRENITQFIPDVAIRSQIQHEMNRGNAS